MLLILLACPKAMAAAAVPEGHHEKSFRWAELTAPSGGKTGFRLLLPQETGVNFTNTLDVRAGEANRVLFNGSGVALGDYNNDGLPDIYFCSLNGRNTLYHNLGGLRFKDVTADSGIVCSNQYCRGAVFADVNGDRSLDLLVATTGDGVLCFLNDGRGKFSDATSVAGTATKYGSVTLALADIDGNGTADLYVANNRTDDIRDRGEVDLRMVNGKLTIPPSLRDRLVVVNGKVLEYGEPDILYLNDGRGHFQAVSWTNGTFLDEQGKNLTNVPLDWALTAMFRDINGDGHPDLYVCNDYWTPDRIWFNDGRGNFRAAEKLAFREISASSMGVDMADLTRSGNVDIFVVDMLSRDLSLRKRQVFAQTPMASPLGAIDNRPQVMRNTLFRNRGDNTFAEIANFAGLAASDWSWSPIFLDVDLDGYEDLLIAAGHMKDVQDLDALDQLRARSRRRNEITQIADPKARLEAFIQLKIENSRLYPYLDMPIVAFRNLGNYRFEETTAQWGTEAPGVHHAMAMGDLDRDGDLDLVVNSLEKAAGIYRNDSAAPRLAVRLKGNSPNTQGIGAKVKLLGGTVPLQSQEVIAGGRYMAGADTELVFAPGKATDGMSLEVVWRSGKRSIVMGVKSNRSYEIDEAGAQDFRPPASAEIKPLFEDVSNLINHWHHETDFNDFERQPGSPRKFSQLGPGVAWADIDGDGWDDLVVGSGKGGRLALFQNDQRRGFKAVTSETLAKPTQQDQAGVVAWHTAGETARIVSALANYEDVKTVPSTMQQLAAFGKGGEETLTNQNSSIGPLALGDMNGDGKLDLFAGGRAITGRYPEPASSQIYQRVEGSWQLDAENTRALEKVGLVSGAVWSDLDGDGFAELVLACEWGAIKIFRNDYGRLQPWNPSVSTPDSRLSTLDQMTGWWNGVTTGDLDGDGQMDIIASNWGLNTPYQATAEHPAVLYYGEFADAETLSLIETEYDPVLKFMVPRRMRERVAEAVPDVPGRFPTHKAFSAASTVEILGKHQREAKMVQANTLASMAFLNRSNHFEARPLPDEAQIAPAFSVNVGDFDGDGNEDVFLSQNFFANQPEVPRYDAGRGILLRGDGTGQLKAVPGHQSGIKVYGEQRGAATADFDQDGRLDLVVTQNGAATRLFRNVTAKPGLRVRLHGPAGNPDGIGAQVRLSFGERFGPTREIHAGSGYWSQDSSAIVFGLSGAPTKIWVRWPGGKVTEAAIPANAKEISVDAEGKVAVKK
jgi:hypothetical protein